MKKQDGIFFKPRWRRIAVTVFCALWALFEWLTQQPFWGMVALGMTGYCYWEFFHTYQDPDQGDSDL